jgi:hypothetical protein
MLRISDIFEIPLELGALTVLTPAQVRTQREIEKQGVHAELWQDIVFPRYDEDEQTEARGPAGFLGPQGGLIAVLASFCAHLAVRDVSPVELKRVRDSVGFEVTSDGQLQIGDLSDLTNESQLRLIDVPRGVWSGRLVLLDTTTDEEPITPDYSP